jgi:hypothetical protein
MTKLRDEAIDYFDRLAAGWWKAAGTKALQDDLAGLTPEQRDVARRCVIAALDHGLHSFLFALSEGESPGGGATVTVAGCDVAEQSDGLHGELFGDDGWFAKFSRYERPHE